MTPAEYGIWGVILVVLDFEYLFVNNGVRQAVAREIAFKKYDAKDIIKKSIVFQILMAGGLTGATIVASNFLAGIFHDEVLAYYLKIASAIVPFTGLYVITQGIHNGLLLLERESVIGIFYSLFKLSIIPFAICLKLPAIEAAEFGFLLAAFMSLIIGCISLYQRRKMLYNREEKIAFVQFGQNAMNYSIFFIMVSAALSIDTLILRFFTKDPDVTGYYTGAVNFGKITYYLLTAFFLVILPIITDLYSQNKFKQLKENVYNLVILINVFVLPITVLLVSTGENLLRLFYGEDYVVSAGPMALLSLSDFFMGMVVVFNMIMEAMGKKKFPALESICMLVMDISLVTFLTGRLGMIGTALASCCCTLFFFQVSGIYLIKLLGGIFDKKILYSFILSLLFGLAVRWLLKKIYLHNLIELLIIYMVFYVVYVGLMYWTKIFDIKTIFKILRVHK